MDDQWTDCNFKMTLDGTDFEAKRYRRIAIRCPDVAEYEFALVGADGSALRVRYEMRRLQPRWS